MHKKIIFITTICCALAFVGSITQVLAFPSKMDTPRASIYTPVFLDGLFSGVEEETKPVAPKNPTDAFNDATEKREIIPFDDPTLKFNIRLPQDWAQISLGMEEAPELSRKLLGDIAIFRGPVMGNTRPKIRIQAIEMPHQMMPHHWLKNHLLSNGFTLEGEIKLVDDTTATASYVHIKNTLTIHAYVSAHIHGNILILSRFEAPLSFQKNLSLLQKASIDSIVFLTPNNRLIELSKVYTLLDSAKIKITDSWKIMNEDIKDSDRLFIEFQNRSPTKSLDGLIRVFAIRKIRGIELQTEVQRIRYPLDTISALRIKQVITSSAIRSDIRFDSAFRDIYIVNFEQRKTQDQELWFATLEDSEWYIFIYLLTPLPQNDLYNWSRNTYTFREMLNKLR